MTLPAGQLGSGGQTGANQGAPFSPLKASTPVQYFTSYTALRANTQSQALCAVAIVTQLGQAGTFVIGTGSDNGGTIIVDANGTSWVRMYNDVVDPRWFGAVNDGVTDNTAAVAAAAALGKTLCFSSPGTFYFASTQTITADMIIREGAMLEPNSGTTLTIAGEIKAGIYQIFTNCWAGQGTIVPSPNYNLIGYVEWFGAISGDSVTNTQMTNNNSAMTACVVAYPITQFLATDYFYNGTFVINTPHRVVRGFSKHWGSPNNSTRLLINSGTLDAIQMGPNTNPGGGQNGFTQEMWLSDMSISRLVTPAGNATYNTCPAGVRCQFLLYGGITNTWSTENSIGYLFAGVVGFKVELNQAFRSVNGSNPTYDPFFGYFYDGTASIGAAGGNASLYQFRCGSSCGGAYATSTSGGTAAFISADCYGYEGACDWYVLENESASLQYGLYINGTGQTSSGTQDAHFVSCIWDGCAKAGVAILNVNSQTAINIVDTYVALAASSVSNGGMYFSSCSGIIAVLGGQILGGLTTGDVGISISSTTGVKVDGTIIRECHVPIQVVSCGNLNLKPYINNPTSSGNSGAIYFSGTNYRCNISADIQGGAGVFASGVNLGGSANTYIEVKGTGIDPACINSGAPNKLLSNGSQITSAGTFSTNCLASGIMN